MVSTFGYVDLSTLSIKVLDKFSAKIGYSGNVKYYRIDALHKFRGIIFETELWQLVDSQGPEINLYLDAEKVSTQHENTENRVDGGDEGIVSTNEEDGIDSELFDSDYNLDDEDNEGIDDALFEKHVDKVVEWTGPNEGDATDHEASSEEEELPPEDVSAPVPDAQDVTALVPVAQDVPQPHPVAKDVPTLVPVIEEFPAADAAKEILVAEDVPSATQKASQELTVCSHALYCFLCTLLILY
ncbi:hypothetical protein Salat_2544100 [Sesamum alatum]|uniref:Uncharacterized protein n=1 Tax=Sesamum alatum TaxID=300844 RepID=A0AAE2CCN9_9LAMI|nr:hypothetical protein Salat_2544100 [Sesamum alatum]